MALRMKTIAKRKSSSCRGKAYFGSRIVFRSRGRTNRSRSILSGSCRNTSLRLSTEKQKSANRSQQIDSDH